MIKIYGRMDCPYCVSAIGACGNQGVDYKFIDINEESGEYYILAYKNKHTTVPLVMDNNDFIGGYDDLTKYLSVHSTWQKFTWWMATIYYFFTSRNCRYATRMKARSECQANQQVQYLSGKGKK